MKLDEYWLYRFAFHFMGWGIGSDGMFKYAKHYFKDGFKLMEQEDGYYFMGEKIETVLELKMMFHKKTGLKLEQVFTVNGI